MYSGGCLDIAVSLSFFFFFSFVLFLLLLYFSFSFLFVISFEDEVRHDNPRPRQVLPDTRGPSEHFANSDRIGWLSCFSWKLNFCLSFRISLFSFFFLPSFFSYDDEPMYVYSFQESKILNKIVDHFSECPRRVWINPSKHVSRRGICTKACILIIGTTKTYHRI